MPTNKLAGVHPSLVRRVEHILAAMQQRGTPMMVTDGVRTAAQQRALYQKGRITAGPRVTNADGYVKRSNHQERLAPSPYAGYGCAVDCCFVTPAGLPSWDPSWPWRDYGAFARALGLVWGGDWSSLVDRPHIELPKEFIA